MYDAARQIYKFDRFDYLKVLDLDGDVHDIRKVELDSLDYMLINYNTCRLKLLLYTEIGFKQTDEVSDFGLIDRWIFLKSNRSLHLLTVANRTCGRGLNNMWKLENNKLTVSVARSLKNEEKIAFSYLPQILISFSFSFIRYTCISRYHILLFIEY